MGIPLKLKFPLLLVTNTAPLLVLRHFSFFSFREFAARTNNQEATVRNVVGVRRQSKKINKSSLRNTQQRRGVATLLFKASSGCSRRLRLEPLFTSLWLD
jgi:hypothetical protein